MVNFSGMLRGLGTGLVQVGQLRAAEQARIAEDQRIMDRTVALERLRSRMANENADIDAARDLKTNALRDEQLLGRRKSELAIQEPHEIAEEGRTIAREEARDRRAAEQEETRDQRELRQEIARENRAAAREEAQERRRLEREGDAVVDRYVNDQDQRVLVTRSGQEIVLTNRVRRTRDNDDDFLGEETSNERSPVAGVVEETLTAGRRVTGAPAARREQGQRAEAVRQLESVYASATPQSHPGLFRNGRKIPLAEARRIVEQRYR